MANIDTDFKNQIFNIQLCIYVAKCAIIILFAYEYKNLNSAGSLLERCCVKMLSQKTDLDLGLINHLIKISNSKNLEV